MPFIISKVKNGFKVCKKKSKKCFSKKPLSLEKAKKQLIAILISESLRK